MPVLTSAVPLFLAALKKYHSHEKVAVAFPDEGKDVRVRVWLYMCVISRVCMNVCRLVLAEEIAVAFPG